ncbi:hypothetical protein ACFL1H_00880 [Nanoarchaeota archaeon]
MLENNVERYGNGLKLIENRNPISIEETLIEGDENTYSPRLVVDNTKTYLTENQFLYECNNLIFAFTPEFHPEKMMLSRDIMIRYMNYQNSYGGQDDLLHQIGEIYSEMEDEFKKGRIKEEFNEFAYEGFYIPMTLLGCPYGEMKKLFN